MLSAIRNRPVRIPQEVAMHHLYALLARIALAVPLAGDAWTRLVAPEAGPASLPPALQLVAALALLGGTWTRTAALAIGVLKVLPGLALPAAGDPQQAIDLARSLLLGGALALLAAYGPGDFSLDAWRRGRTGGSNDPHMNPGGAL